MLLLLTLVTNRRERPEAEFVVTPTLNLATIELCRRYSVPTVIGAFTPTEILTAWQAGATYVKVFPATVGGPHI